MKYLFIISLIVCTLNGTNSYCMLHRTSKANLKNIGSNLLQFRKYNAGLPEIEPEVMQQKQKIQALEKALARRNNTIAEQNKELAQLKHQLALKKGAFPFESDISDDPTRHYCDIYNMHYGNRDLNQQNE